MTESHLLGLIERLYKDCNKYCVICLRTDKERRLEPPKYLKTFFQTLAQPFKLDRPFQMVCYICERQAASAYRFWLASQVAAHAHTLVHELVLKPKKRERLTGAMQNSNTKENQAANHPLWLKDMLDCEIKIRRQRMLSQLVSTEVLSVSSNATSTPNNPPDVKTDEKMLIPDHNYIPKPLSTAHVPVSTDPCSGPGKSRDLYVIPDALPPDEACDIEIKDEILESIVVIHDDDEKPKKVPKLMIDSGKIYMDSSKDNRSRKYVTKPENTIQENQLYVATRVESSDNTIANKKVNFLLHPIIIEGDSVNVPSLSANIRDGRLITEQNGKLQMEIPQIAFQCYGNINFISDPTEVISKLQKLARIEGNLKSGSEGSLKSGSEGSFKSGRLVTQTRHSDVNSTSEVRQDVAKAPQLRSDRIDWEDKIPMDVISFIDDEFIKKQDANARKMPPIGISNVTSLDPSSNVIDLC